MELRQLRYFLATAETLSFSAAARQLCISQSTLSEQIRQLEDEMGAPLFLRHATRIELTDTGQALIERARTTLQHADSCRRLVKEQQARLSGELNIGVTYSFSTLLSDTLREFVSRYPEVTLKVSYASNEELSNMLQVRQIDFALAYQNYRHDNVLSEVLFADHVQAIMRDDHPLAKRERITLEELQNYHLILPTRLMRSRAILDTELQRRQLNLKADFEISDANFLLEMVERNAHYLTILASGTARHRPCLRTISLDLQQPDVLACLHRLRDDHPKPSAIKLMEMISLSEQVQIIRCMQQ